MFASDGNMKDIIKFGQFVYVCACIAPILTSCFFLIRRWASFLGNEWCKKRVGVQVNVKIFTRKQTYTNASCGSFDLFAMMFVVHRWFFCQAKAAILTKWGRLLWWRCLRQSCLARTDGCGISCGPGFQGWERSTRGRDANIHDGLMFDVCWNVVFVYSVLIFIAMVLPENGVKNKKNNVFGEHSIDNLASKVTWKKYQLQTLMFS